MTPLPWGCLHPHAEPGAPQPCPGAGCALTARLRTWTVSRAWLRLECLLRACAEVRRLWDPAGRGIDCMTPHIPAPTPEHPLPSTPALPELLCSCTGSRSSWLPSERHRPWDGLRGLNPPIPSLAPPEHVPAPCLWLSTLQEQADDGLQALEFHTELVLHVEAAGFAPAQGQGARWSRAQQVPDLAHGRGKALGERGTGCQQGRSGRLGRHLPVRCRSPGRKR